MHGIIEHPADWRRADLEADDDLWLRHFTPEAIEEIDAGLRFMQGRGIGMTGDRSLKVAAKEDFPLPNFADDLAEMRDELQNGIGFQMYRGFPVERYSRDELRQIYWGIALHTGMPVSQSKYGDILGDVRDLNTEPGLTARGYTSNTELSFHSDGCDVTGLFCLQVAKKGGLSRLVSAVAVHNEICRQRPDLLEVLYEPFLWSWRGHQKPGVTPFYEQPVFGFRDGKFVTRYLRAHIEFGYQEAGKELSAKQIEALDLLDSLTGSPEYFIEKPFVPGDIQFQNNFLLYHSRTEFEDYPEDDRKRHLLRLWLSVPNSPALPDSFSVFFRDVGAGAVRGGNLPYAEDVTFETTRTN